MLLHRQIISILANKYFVSNSDGNIIDSSYGTLILGGKYCTLFIWDWDVQMLFQIHWNEIHYISVLAVLQIAAEYIIYF